LLHCIGCLGLLIMFIAVSASAESPVLQHAKSYAGNEDVSGWMMSEKLDGIRGYWTGSKLLTRKGRTIHAPAWFVNVLPPFALDGELWRKRNDYPFVQKTVLDTVPSEDWREITYNIFEVPGAPGEFLARLERARAWFRLHPAQHVHVIEQIVCTGPEHLDHFLAHIASLGGEGVIVKDPVAPFHVGDCPDVLKVKKNYDLEGRVIAHNPGKGQYSEMMGSLTLRLENGIEFKLGTGFSLEERKNPPPVGTLVSFKYHGFTETGIPRFASFLRERKD